MVSFITFSRFVVISYEHLPSLVVCITCIFRSSLLEGTSVFDSSGSTDVDTFFEGNAHSGTSMGHRGRLPGRLSSSSLGISSVPIRSVNNLFPRPEFGEPTEGP